MSTNTTTDPTWRAPHKRSSKAARARQLKADHPELTTAEIAGRCGMSLDAAWSALAVMRGRSHKGPDNRKPSEVKAHPVLAHISPSRRHNTAHDLKVARDPAHPEHTHRSLPMTRAECPTERPCPHVSCRHHMATDYAEHGVQVFDLPPSVPTCSLDIADRGAITLEEVAVMMGVCRERVRQIEGAALMKIRVTGGRALAALAAHHGECE